jgi:para-nitrobenzyl esterase
MSARYRLLFLWTLALAPACGGSRPDVAPQQDASSPDTGDEGGAVATDAGSVAEAGASCAPGDAGGPVVQIDVGCLQGTATSGGSAFLGVPFAAPPSGSLRWKPPQAVSRWSDVYDATRPGNECVQLDAGKLAGSEDCLNLDLWTPSLKPSSPLPVMVFIHGGGNTIGSASAPGLNGQYLAQAQGVVVINVNYRLGLLGFLAHPALDAESPFHVSGNYALLDQIAALQWVQRNVAAFGGDPKRVLLYGQSGGARDTCMQLASSLSKGLFSAALMESGNCEETRFLDRIDTLKATEDRYAPIVAQSRCDAAADVAACLRAVPTEDLVGVTQASLGPDWEPLPNVDGYVLADFPFHLFVAGLQPNSVPFVIGTNQDEFALPGLIHPPITDAAAYAAKVRALFGDANAAQILAEYPAQAYPSAEDALVALWSEQHFTCPARRYARAVAAGQSAKVYRYFFTRMAANGASHGLELRYLFHTFASGAPAADEQLADEIEGYWARFAATGDPNGSGATEWPTYGASDPFLQLDVPPTAGEGVRTAHCDFWDALTR